MNIQEQFLQILDEELVFALGCTEPTALALASSKCRQILGDFPDSIHARLSGNMIKNVKGVTIPHSGGLLGIRSAIILGAMIDEDNPGLNVLSFATDEHREKTIELTNNDLCTYERADNDIKLYIEIEMKKGENSALIELTHTHTNITRINKNGKDVFFNPCSVNDFNSSLTSRKGLSVEAIFEFCNTVDYTKLIPILEKQMLNNMEIATEGITNEWGLNVGRTLLESKGDHADTSTRMRSFAAAGSDARMSGSDLPVVINSGSGNQGMTIAIPISIYIKENNVPIDQGYRALAMANLIPIHIKTSIGRLSAFCGAITASIGVGAALAYLESNDLDTVKSAIQNAIANLVGVICDGAKPSCALKIASGLDAALLAKDIAVNGRMVQSGTGIIYEDVEDSIKNMTTIAANAMVETDEMIIDIMSKYN